MTALRIIMNGVTGRMGLGVEVDAGAVVGQRRREIGMELGDVVLGGQRERRTVEG